MDFSLFFGIAFSAILASNFVLAKFLGLCPCLRGTRQTESAIGMGIAVTFVMFLASLATSVLYNFVLVPYDLALLKTPVFVLVIAVLVQLVEVFIRARMPALHRALGVYLPMVATNCAVMGVALLGTSDAPARFAELTAWARVAAAAWQGICAGTGLVLATLLMSGVRERIERADVPECLRGMPLAFIGTGLMAMAFFGFAGMV